LRWSPWNPRLLVYVYVALQEGACEVDEVMVSAELVRQGYAQVVTRQPKTRQPNVKYQDRFLTLQREAWEARRGLWGAP
jgi:micrococcal nuclease